MKQLIAIFTFLLAGVSAFSQIDIPLSHSMYLTSYKDGEVVQQRHLTHKMYKADRIVRYENYDPDGTRQSWFQLVSDDKENVIEEIWCIDKSVDTIKHIYLDVGIWSTIRYWGDDETYDSIRYHYNDKGFAETKVERNIFGTSVDSMFYEDSLMVKISRYDEDNKLHSYTTYRHNRKGLVYIQTDHNPDGFVNRRTTLLYNSNRDVKEEHVQTYSKDSGVENEDYAWFFKYDVDFKKVKTKYYNYAKKKKTLSKYKYDEQGRVVSYFTRNKKEGTKQVYDFEYP